MHGNEAPTPAEGNRAALLTEAARNPEMTMSVSGQQLGATQTDMTALELEDLSNGDVLHKSGSVNSSQDLLENQVDKRNPELLRNPNLSPVKTMGNQGEPPPTLVDQRQLPSVTSTVKNGPTNLQNTPYCVGSSHAQTSSAAPQKTVESVPEKLHTHLDAYSPIENLQPSKRPHIKPGSYSSNSPSRKLENSTRSGTPRTDSPSTNNHLFGYAKFASDSDSPKSKSDLSSNTNDTPVKIPTQFLPTRPQTLPNSGSETSPAEPAATCKSPKGDDYKSIDNMLLPNPTEDGSYSDSSSVSDDSSEFSVPLSKDGPLIGTTASNIAV